MASQLRVTVRVELADGGDAAEVEEAVENLRAELSDAPVDVERVTAANAPPPGSKGGFGFADALLIAAPALTADLVGQFLLDWIGRRRRNTTLRIEGPEGQVVVLPDTAPTELRRVLAAWAAGTPV